jgi:hypothetical protein
MVILNDLGRAGMRDIKGRSGYAIPLDKRTVLTLTKGPNCPRLAFTDTDRWVVGPIALSRHPEDSIDDLNKALTSQARMEIYGSDPELVSTLHSKMHPSRPPSWVNEPGLLSESSTVLRDRDLEFYKLRTFIKKPPSQRKGMNPEDVAIFED